MLSVADQIISFLLIMALGIIAGFLFDCYRTIRLNWRPKRWGTVLGDGVFWFLLTTLTYSFLMIRTWGEVRLYVFLSMGLGVLIYLKFFSLRVSVFLRRFYTIFVKVIKKFMKIAGIPFAVLAKILFFPFKMIGALVILITRAMKKILSRIHPPPPPENIS